jgi:signal transduction histidine kinase
MSNVAAIRQSNPSPTPVPRRRKPDRRADRRGRSILVVEDDTAIREALMGVLTNEGYGVAGSSDGAEALRLLREGDRPDAIVLDLMMPVMDGWSFRVEQKRDPALAGIPVIALTADGTAKAAAIDADAYLRKPVGYDALLAAVDNAILRLEARELRVRLDEAARLASLATLAAGIAHEINNPLSYTLLSVEQVLRRLRVLAGAEGAPPELGGLVESLERAVDGGDRVKQLVSQLVTFSGGSVDSRSLVDVRSVVESAIQLTSHEIFPRARLLRDLAPVPPVDANDVRLGQVFQALLLNAARAIPEGDAERHEVRVSTRVDADGRVVVEIADTGCGIAPDDLPRIFDPFFTSRAVGEGQGLGLSVAHGTVRGLGGELRVASDPGYGSVFSVLLPSSPGMRRSSGVMAVSERPRVLVVDDDARLTRTLAQALETECDVETAGSARQALDRLAQGALFDVVLCALEMPLQSGMDLYRETLRIAPELARGFVFVTGGALTPGGRAFLQGAPVKHVEKPMDLSVLLDLVRSARRGNR